MRQSFLAYFDGTDEHIRIGHDFGEDSDRELKKLRTEDGQELIWVKKGEYRLVERHAPGALGRLIKCDDPNAP